MNLSKQTVPTGEAASPDDLVRADAARRRLKLAAWTSAGLAALLGLSVLLTVDYAVVWSIGGFMHISGAAIWIAAGVGALGCIWVAIKFFRTALRNELDLTRSDPGAS